MALTEMTPSEQACETATDAAGLAPLLRLVLGAALVLASLGLWLAPGAAIAPSMVLFKLGASIGMMTWGLGLFSGALEQRV
ncbi:hypothetical protein [Antarctobacter jejuensis]|uniref:hypothetical protein n=1 Tax=Antarctobacter jejuensis TaxID=1439938 RepID=UPI003FD6BB87